MNLNQVTIFTIDAEASIRFYTRLGLNLIVDSSPRYVRFECPDGESTLSIHETDEDTANNSIVLYFECEDLDSTVSGLRAKGISFESGPEDKEWLWREAALVDPDGNRIILFHAGENRKHPPWRVKD
ncbi:MAG: VOC family protein [Acidobacteria bacterium]|nr:MAG: VOC family protein [Acidobacteriota bacterium]REK02707.1 MAG: VOC family protein [Acidobacteriota bacterium]REK13488.1 MAG: VOC family protein [Acidobacteriota bacterium]REK41482.1 MAG: VOC family protein [Acidobacteriota bacterium]